MTNLQNSFAHGFLRRRTAYAVIFGGKSGQTLIIVLGFVALMTVLILAFFESVAAERTSSKAAASGESARQLAQSAVQLVEGVITTATVPTKDTTIAWASQPGMIRTYGTPSGTAGTAGTPSSSPLAYYKLYSSSNMVINSTSPLPVNNYTVDADVAAGGDLLSNWSSLPALYTDLNAPAYASDGTLVFPIVDPRAASAGSAPVDGFSYSASTPTGNITKMAGVTGSGAAGSLLPMPVQWIYVLQDGSLTTPAEPTADPATASNVANFTGSNPPTATNPIVGRIAFWTDDDCAKVNLNTASEGTYWDAPIANSGAKITKFTYPQTAPVGDAQLAAMQPAQNEYQRYPGHPATTCLSEVFGNAITAPTRQALVQTIDATTPRISDSSSLANNISSLGGTQNSTATLQSNFYRLYATVDDFNFTSARAQPARAQQNLGTAATTQQIIEQSRFFLTTSSKGSDLNLFGLPRVTIWPVWDGTGVNGGTYPGVNNAAKRSTTDNEMIHCSTVTNSAVTTPATYPYEKGTGSEHLMEFTRDTALDPKIDYNLTRNQQLIAYLHNLMATGVPGFGGSFAAKYPAPSFTSTTDSDQILTEIFDYIRCTNLADQSMLSSFTGGTASNVCTSSYTPSSTVTGTNLSTGTLPLGEVIPTQGIGTARGFGRFPTISGLCLVMAKIDDRFDQKQNEGLIANPNTPPVPAMVLNRVKTMTVTNGGPISTVDPASQTLIEWALIPQFFCPMAGYAGMGNNIRVQFIIKNLSFGLTSMPSTINVNPLSGTYAWPITTTATTTTPFTPDLFDGAFPFPTGNVIYALPGLLTAGRVGGGRDSVIGGVVGPLEMLTAYGSFYPNGLVRVQGTNAADLGTSTLTVTAGSITVKIYSPAGTGATGTGVNLIQTLNFSIPPPGLTVPMPNLAWYGKNAAGQNVGNSSFVNGTFRSNSSAVVSPPLPVGSANGPTSTSTFTYGTDASARNAGRQQNYIPISGNNDSARA